MRHRCSKCRPYTKVDILEGLQVDDSTLVLVETEVAKLARGPKVLFRGVIAKVRARLLSNAYAEEVLRLQRDGEDLAHDVRVGGDHG